MALPLFWGGLLLFWAFASGRKRDDAHADLTSGETEGGELIRLQAYMQAQPVLPRSMKRLMMRGQRQVRTVRSALLEGRSLLPTQELGAVFWLVFLGGVLVVMGLAQ